jgi:hypothetical protein
MAQNGGLVVPFSMPDEEPVEQIGAGVHFGRGW